MPEHVVQITADIEPFRESAKELTELLGRVPLNVRQQALDLLETPTKIFRIESETTAGAVKVTFHPSDALLELIATIRASNL